ncbi:MAG: hypothetical protein QF363_07380, partial [Planctomycetaceae bacterium]|nr:hypothetical protein [Planctomycetaceae bacterium]
MTRLCACLLLAGLAGCGDASSPDRKISPRRRRRPGPKAVTSLQKPDIQSATSLERLGASITRIEGKVVMVNFQRTEITDAEMVHLADLSHLKSLDLYSSLVSDAGLVHLANLDSLQSLGLGKTRITDAGFVHLLELRNLQTLNLNGTRVTDAGLVHLAGFQQLRSLNLVGTSISDNGLVQLKTMTELQTLSLPS